MGDALQPYSSQLPQGFPVQPVAPAGPWPQCSYCGAPLNPQFYFCTSCATPYVSDTVVLPPVVPPYLSEGMLIQRKAPATWSLFWTYVGVLLGSSVVAFLLFHDRRPDLALLFGVLALAVTTCVLAALHWRSLVPQFKEFGFHKPWAWGCIGILAPLLAINYGYHSFWMHLLKSERMDVTEKLRQAGLGEVALIFLFCIFPAVTEEIAFRGLLQHWVQLAIKPMRAIILASFLFAAMHFSILSLPYLFCVGMLLGWAKYKTNSLYPSMLIHFLHNLIVIECFRH